MRTLWRKIAVVLISLCAAVAAESAQDIERPISTTNVFRIGFGAAERADTYLTPLFYDGWTTNFEYEHFHAMRNKSLVWGVNAKIGVDRTMNPVRNASMLGAELSGRWTMMYRHGLGKLAEFGVGGATSFDVGALYLSRNGNNPVAANGSLTVDIAAYATIGFKLGRLPLRAMYRATLPFAGVMFTPEYGQLYYEIYLGERKGLVSAAYWGPFFRMDQVVSVDMKLGSKWLHIGYGVDIVSTKVHDIVSRRVNQVFILGLSTGWLSR